ncbi:MAG: alpha/beta hydrolase [Pedobacter agri]
MMKIKFNLGLLFFALPLITSAQIRIKEIVYKRVNDRELNLKLFYPAEESHEQKAAILFFFGGGWISGSPVQFEEQAKHFASLGMVGITADYRTKSKDGTTPFEAVEDAKSALTYIHEHAKDLGINRNKIIASGGSAGGHLAAATDLVVYGNSQAPRPNALILFNPVFNNGPGNYGYERVKEQYKVISPYHNIKRGAAPTLIVFGTKDHLVPVDTAKQYQQVMLKYGNRCDLKLYENQKHGFFNYRTNGNNSFYHETLNEADKFLKSLGYLK